MKFFDKTKIIFRDIVSNRIKTLVSFLEIILFSLLTIIITIMIFTYISNSKKIVSSSYNVISENDKYLSWAIRIDGESSNNDFKTENIKAIEQVLIKNKDKLDEIRYNRFDNNVYITEMFFINKIKLTYIEGNEEIQNDNTILVSNSFLNKYEKDNKIDMALGDVIDFDYSGNNYSGILGGVYDSESFDSDIIVDFSIMYQQHNTDEFRLNVKCVLEGTMKEKYSAIEDIVAEIDNVINTNFGEYKVSKELFEWYYECKMLYTINNILIAVWIVLVTVLCIISSVSIVNIMKITLEENEDVISIYKAYGIKKADFLFIYLAELFIELLIGILFASCITLIFKAPIVSLVKNLLSILYSTELAIIDVKITLEFPPYVIVVIIGLFTIVLLSLYLKKLLYIYNKKNVLVVE